MNLPTLPIHSLLTASKMHDSTKQVYIEETLLFLELTKHNTLVKNCVLFPKKATLDWHESVRCCTEGPRRVSAQHNVVYTPAQMPNRHDLYLLTGASTSSRYSPAYYCVPLPKQNCVVLILNMIGKSKRAGIWTF